jgi:hypothetical protein
MEKWENYLIFTAGGFRSWSEPVIAQGIGQRRDPAIPSVGYAVQPPGLCHECVVTGEPGASVLVRVIRASRVRPARLEWPAAQRVGPRLDESTPGVEGPWPTSFAASGA